MRTNNISNQNALFDCLDSFQYTVKSLFAGAGGMDLGLQNAGLCLEESYEFWDKACDTLTENFSHSVYKCDISKLMLNGQKRTFCITATFPCTHFSTAGLRDGDELYLEAHRIIRCMEPEIFVIENVPNMDKFDIVMEAFMKMPRYNVQKFILNAADFGAPQNRKRLIIIGSKQPFDWIFEPVDESKKQYLADIIEQGVDIPLSKGILNRLEGKNKGQWPAHIYDPTERKYGPTAVAHYGKDRGDQLLKDPYTNKIRPFTETEYAGLQGFSSTYKFSGGKAATYKQIGNAVSPYMSRAIGEQILRYIKHISPANIYNEVFVSNM